MKIFRFLIIISYIAYGSASAFAAFENNSYGARINSLAGAFVSVADDSQTVFVQPAGLVNLERSEVSLSYGRLFWGLNDGSEIISPVLSFGWPITQKIGVGFGYKSIELINTYTERTIIGSVAYRYKDIGSAGLNLKSLGVAYKTDEYTRTDPVLSNKKNKSAFDIDFGIFCDKFAPFSFGYTRGNILGADMGIKAKSKISGTDRIGVTYKEEGYMATLENVRIKSRDYFLLGIEKMLWNNIMAFRFGVGWGNNEFRKITTGFGFDMKQYSFNYSLDYPLNGLEGIAGTHYLTVNFKMIKLKRKEKQPKKKKAKKEPVKAKEEKKEIKEENKETKKEKEKEEQIKKLKEALKKKQEEEQKIKEAEQARKEKEKFPVFPNTDTVFVPNNFYPLVPVLSLDPLTSEYIEEKKEEPEPVIPEETTPKVLPEVIPETKIEESPKEVKTAQEIAPKPGPEVIEKEALGIESQPAAVPGVKPQPETSVKRKEKRIKPLLESHKVKAGETLPSLAQKYYGKKSEWIKIYEANKDKIEKGSIRAGQILVIP
ncbi:MAG: LysM peptidoglycan-binding domain-containing protein [Endomicrobiales bacterium]|nr:LysM peptidoglycan-binding domain-containing protein [Endomicrobiales bacterium]